MTNKDEARERGERILVMRDAKHDGWLRVLGSGSAQVPRSLDEWNGLNGVRRFDAGLLVADDALGGFFCWFRRL